MGVVAIAGLATVVRATGPILSGPDPFWHWDLGRRILSRGLPRTDPYSFLTVGEDWVLNQWGTETLIGIVDTVGGLWLLAASTSFLVGAVIFVVGWRMWHRAPSLITVGLLGLVYTACLSNLTLRGNLFTFLLLPILLSELAREDGPRMGVVVVLVLVWTNLHAGFLLGIAALVVHSLGAILASEKQQRRGTALARGRLVLAATVATLITPYGPRLITQVMQLTALGRSSAVTEWGPPNLLEPAVLPFTALLATALVSTAVAGRLNDLPDILLVVLFTVVGVSAARNVAPAAIALGYLSAPHLVSTWEQLGGRTRSMSRPDLRPVDRALAWAIAVVALGLAIGLVPRTGAVAAHAHGMPLATIEQVGREGRPARVFSTPLWTPAVSILGGAHILTSVDGRLELFESDEIWQWQTVEALLPGWDDQLDEWCISDAIVPARSELAIALEAHADWSLRTEHPVPGTDVEAAWLSRQGTACP